MKKHYRKKQQCKIQCKIQCKNTPTRRHTGRRSVIFCLAPEARRFVAHGETVGFEAISIKTQVGVQVFSTCLPAPLPGLFNDYARLPGVVTPG